MLTSILILVAVEAEAASLAQRMVWILKGRLSVPGVMAVVAVALLAWLIAGLRLRGASLILWLLVPVLALVACLCVAGPGRLFPKHAYEGEVVVPIGARDAVTMLDLVGVGLAAVSAMLAITLIRFRLRRTPPSIA